MTTTQNTIERDFEEAKTSQLLAVAKKSGNFGEIIEYQNELQTEHGYLQSVALMIACKHYAFCELISVGLIR